MRERVKQAKIKLLEFERNPPYLELWSNKFHWPFPSYHKYAAHDLKTSKPKYKKMSTYNKYADDDLDHI